MSSVGVVRHNGVVRISVITICKNSEATIERTIKSVIGQDWPDLEYVIVDGASEDQTLRIIDRYRSHFNTVTSEPDSGISEAFNKGLAKISGDLVLLINSDDQIVPGGLKQIAKDWDELGRPDVLCGSIRYYNPGSGSSFKEIPNLAFLHRYMSVFHPSMVVTRDAYQQIGDFREDYKVAMDSEWVHRAMRLGARVRCSRNVYSIMSLDGVSDVHFLDSLREFRRSTRENGSYRLTTDVYFCQQLAFKSAMKISWLKALKYRIDANRKQKEWHTH